MAWGSGHPPSKHPRLADGTAVPPATLQDTFSRISGAHYPARHALPCRRDYGMHAEGTQIHRMPPDTGKAYGSLVAAVNNDGNEIAGITLPEIAAPLTTYTGWTLRHATIGGSQQLLMFAGGTIPFAVNEIERQATADPRPSIMARYASMDDYLHRVSAAAERLVRARYLLEEDIEVCVAQAQKFWRYFVEGNQHRHG